MYIIYIRQIRACTPECKPDPFPRCWRGLSFNCLMVKKQFGLTFRDITPFNFQSTRGICDG